MEIVKYPHPTLRKKARPLAALGEEVAARVRGMFELMYQAQGIGLAAPQVDWGVRLFVLNVGEKIEEEEVFVNPAVEASDGRETAEEGCLSLPEIRGKVARATRVTVRAQDLQGAWRTVEADGLRARAIQHEMDHLDGVLITQRMTAAEQKFFSRRLKELEAEFAETAGRRR